MKLLAPDLVGSLCDMRLRAARVPARSGAGDRAAEGSGAGLEFTDHREYQPGDDLKHVDVAAFARFGRPVIKQYRPERSLHATVILDGSASMRFGSPSKSVFSRGLVAGLACAALSGRDRISIVPMQDSTRSRTFRAGGRDRVGDALAWIEALDSDGLAANGFEGLLSTPRVAGELVVVVSDFLDDGALAWLQALSQQVSHLVAIHVLAPSERKPDISQGSWTLDDVETGKSVSVTIDDVILERYVSELETYEKEIRDVTLGAGGQFISLTSNRSLHEVLLHTLPSYGVLV